MNRIARTIVLCQLTALICLAIMSAPTMAQKHQRVSAKDGSGVYGYKDTPVQPWSGYHVHDPDRPLPPKVVPGQAGTQAKAGTAPSDAVVLFNGTDDSKWKPADWTLEEGCLVATGGLLLSKQKFGDCQLHLEWQAPVELEKNEMNQGNAGVQFLGGIEVQVFDSYRMKIYPDGQAAAIYAQTPPLVNACRKPGQWQTYDIVFTAPRFDQKGKLSHPARLTMFHNGVLVHLNQEIYGHSPHAGLANYRAIPAEGPIGLMGHHCPVRFRNIWVRPLAKPKK